MRLYLADMNWVNASDVIPEDGQEVLIRCGSEYHLAVYDAAAHLFKARKHMDFSPSNTSIQWVFITQTLVNLRGNSSTED